MKPLFCLVLFVFATALFAETQEEAYYRAMKYEESGDIEAALQAFEEAAALPGEYTEELQGIIRDYKAALGKSKDESADSIGFENSWEFHVAGELSFYGLRYKATGMDESEIGGDLFLNVNPYVDYLTELWSHTFAASVQGDYFLNNDKMTMLDTNDWNLVLGLEYTLFGRGLLFDVGYDFNIEGETLSSDFFGFVEKDLFRFEKQRVGLVGWAYYQTSGPMSFALYGAWHRNVNEGLNGTVYLGAKVDGDSIYFWKDLVYIDSISGDTATERIIQDGTGKWFGPLFRSRLSYKFKNRITLEAKMNLFYGFPLDPPDAEYGKIRKITGLWGLTFSWKYWKMNYYLGLEHSYKHYDLPELYRKFYDEVSRVTKLKLGVKWDI